ncbi:MAG: glyoxalase superfamily protein [Rhizobium sp.]|nr:glyoxalase superfamily protein [Rhizobium sp.]
MRDVRDAKLMARTLKAELAKSKLDIATLALELVAKQLGADHGNILAARIEAERHRTAVPFRARSRFSAFSTSTRRWNSTATISASPSTSSTASARIFRSTAKMSRGACVLHLSEHAGDASPGAKAFALDAGPRRLPFGTDGQELSLPQTRAEGRAMGAQMTVTDPFSNRIAFCERG